MTLTQKTLLALVVALAPLSTIAAVPPMITDIQAKLTSGILTVTWTQPVGSADIAFYRVYFSHESILARDGNYDDFERTKGPETVITFTKLPLQSKEIFFAVLAINTAGRESEGFETETSIDVPENTQAPASAQFSSAVSSSAASQTSPANTGPAFVPYGRSPMLEQVNGDGENLPVPPPVTERPKDLSDSGLGLFGIVVISGLAAGRRFLRPKQRETVLG